MRTRLLSFGWLIVVTVSIQAAENRSLPQSWDLTAIDEFVSQQVGETGMVGLSLAILRDGEVVLAKGYGKCSVNDARPVTTETAFAAGSITKQFTCAAVLLLAEEGRLSVNDKVIRYLPKLTRAADITLYDLMAHTSGYPDYYPLDFVDRRMHTPISYDELISQYATRELDFEPGTRWSYSNTGYTILGKVIELVSGQSFDQFVTDHLLKPAGMKNAHSSPDAEMAGLAQGHVSYFLQDWEPAKREGTGWINAAGCLYCSAADLASWDLSLMTGRLLKPDSCNLMFSSRKLSNGRSTSYGCGVCIRTLEGEDVIHHSGAVSGFLAFNSMVPRTRSAVVLMANSEDARVEVLHDQLLTLLLKTQTSVPSVPKIAGPIAREAVIEIFNQLQTGQIRRENLGDEYNVFLSEERLQRSKSRLEALGELQSVAVEQTVERGGMEVANANLTFMNGRKIRVSLYRTTDGKVQQFLLYKQ